MANELSLTDLLAGMDYASLEAKLEPGAITAADQAELLATEAEIVRQIEERLRYIEQLSPVIN